MRTRLVLKPGQRGTKKLVAEYGERLIYVRYRYDIERRWRVKTIELIVHEGPWEPKPARRAAQADPPPALAPGAQVYLLVQRHELDLRNAVKAAGGQWSSLKRCWKLRYDTVVALGLEQRVIGIVEQPRRPRS